MNYRSPLPLSVSSHAFGPLVHQLGQLLLLPSPSRGQLCPKHLQVATQANAGVSPLLPVLAPAFQQLVVPSSHSNHVCFLSADAVRPALFLNPDTDVGDILSYIPKAVLRKVRLGRCCWGCFFCRAEEVVHSEREFP